MAFYTFARTSNNTTNGVNLTQAGQGSATQDRDIEIYKIIIGAPVTAGNITVYDTNNAVNGATTNIMFKLTLPTLAAGQMPVYLDVSDGAGHGIVCGNGANLQIDQNMQVTVVWDYRDESGK